MAKGTAGILLPFSNDCVDGTGNSEDGDCSIKRRRYNKVADYTCATIVSKIVGGKFGLPVLGGLDVLPDGHEDNHLVKDSDSDDGSDDGGASDGEILPMMAIQIGEFVSLGQDCIFPGKI